MSLAPVVPAMSPADGPGRRPGAPEEPRFPAYGPVEALLGYLLFYVVLTRATPTFVDVVTDVFPSLSPSLVGLGLAAFLWFVLAVTVVAQARRQLAALGVVDGEPDRPTVWSLVVPKGASTATSLLVLVVAGAVALSTFDAAITTAVSAIRWVAALDAGAFVSVEFLVLVVFFVSYGVATTALDRLVVGGVRATLAD